MKQERAGGGSLKTAGVEDYYEMVAREGLSLSGYERNRLFINTGNARFVDGSFISGLDVNLDGRGTALADFDHDGDLDILQANTQNRRILYFRNDTPSRNHALHIRLRGTPPNTQALGAQVRVTVGGRVLTQTVQSGSAYLAQSTSELVFGIGEHDTVESIEVSWPAPVREVKVFPGAPADARFILDQRATRQRAERLRPRNFNRADEPARPDQEAQ